MKVRVLCDMDGVITDFRSKYKELLNVSDDEFVELVYPKDRQLQSQRRFNWNRAVDAKIFEQLEMLHDVHDLFSGLENLKRLGYIDSIEICTSAGGASRFFDVKPQKEHWLDSNGFANYVRHIVVNGSAKASVCSKEWIDILIDDTMKVVDEFKSESSKVNLLNTAILHTSVSNTLEILKGLLDERTAVKDRSVESVELATADDK